MAELLERAEADLLCLVRASSPELSDALAKSPAATTKAARYPTVSSSTKPSTGASTPRMPTMATWMPW